MDLTVILTGVGTAFTIIGFVYGFFRNFKKDISSDINDLKNELKTIEFRMDRDMRIQSERSDKLYTMFIDLLKEIKE